MLLVLAVWFIVKNFLASRRQTPYKRVIYEGIFQELAAKHPLLWSVGGPRADVRPDGFFSKLKWRLINAWFSPEKTIRKATSGNPEHDMEGGVVERIQRSLIRRWLNEIRTARRNSADAVELGYIDVDDNESILSELVTMSTPALLAIGEPEASQELATAMKLRSQRRSSSPKGSSGGIMVDERDASDEDQSDASARQLSPPRLSPPATASSARGKRTSQ